MMAAMPLQKAAMPLAMPRDMLNAWGNAAKQKLKNSFKKGRQRLYNAAWYFGNNVF